MLAGGFLHNMTAIEQRGGGLHPMLLMVGPS